MSRCKSPRLARCRIGRVSLFFHHGTWWLYYRCQGRQVRRRVASTRSEAEQVAAQINAQLTVGAPPLVAFTPVAVSHLRQQFLDYHEHVLRSSLATIRRYRAATQHLEAFAVEQSRPPLAHEVRGDVFAAYLRAVESLPTVIHMLGGAGCAIRACFLSWRRVARSMPLQPSDDTCRPISRWERETSRSPSGGLRGASVGSPIRRYEASKCPSV